MENYYAKSLNAAKLYQVYDTKVERIRQFLDAEIQYVQGQLKKEERVLELGAGYGRIMKELAPFAQWVAGIDIAEGNVELGKEYLKDCPNCSILVMDAHDLAFEEEFDVVLCLQNGISALKGQDVNVVRQALKVMKPGGRAYFSSYSSKIWGPRVEWFQEQADKGLLGKIDLDKTRDGNIVCEDGFTATTYTPEDMERLARAVGCPYRIFEVDDSSVFLLLEKEG